MPSSIAPRRLRADRLVSAHRRLRLVFGVLEHQGRERELLQIQVHRSGVVGLGEPAGQVADDDDRRQGGQDRSDDTGQVEPVDEGEVGIPGQRGARGTGQACPATDFEA